jgi:hypothetical protein
MVEARLQHINLPHPLHHFPSLFVAHPKPNTLEAKELSPAASEVAGSRKICERN